MAALKENQNIILSPAISRNKFLRPATPGSPRKPTAARNLFKAQTHDVVFKQGMCVFVPDPVLAWVPAVISQVEQNHLLVNTETKQVSKRRCAGSNVSSLGHSITGQGVEVSASDVVLRAVSCDYTCIDDLTKLSPLSTPAVLQSLRERYHAHLIYTYAGHAVIAVNPFQQIPDLYSVSTLWQYHKTSQSFGEFSPTLPAPHIYQVAEQAYSHMRAKLGHVNQSVIVSGESGAGKTVSAKHLMRYLVTVANRTTTTAEAHSHDVSSVGCQTERRILGSNPILEAFGNASTLRNHNSSRFGKFIQLHFDSKHHIDGASIQTYLLEKTRVVHQAALEYNFHVFYQILSGLEPDQKEKLHLDGGRSFNIARTGTRDSAHDLQQWQVTLQALNDLDLPAAQLSSLLEVLAALLHLGDVQFCPDEEDEEVCIIDVQAEGCQDAATHAAALLGIDLDELEKTFTHRRITAVHRRRHSVFCKPCTLVESVQRRNCLSKLVYARLFEWLVNLINLKIHSSHPVTSIGLLDIYGFECFKFNSLEQLCINYANEKLQQHYVSHFLRELQDDYAQEAIHWEPTSFTDNRPCLDLLEATPGIFALLNEECQLNRPCVDDDLSERLLTSLAQSSHLGGSRTDDDKPEFIIAHYAAPVTYAVSGLIDKNKDDIPAELIELLQTSENLFVAQLFDEQQQETSLPGKKKKTVLAKFKGSLDSLMSVLSHTEPHYIRCIKPNTHALPNTFDAPYVLNQLQACGVIETVDISRKGFPTRIPYEEFLAQYGLILHSDLPSNAPASLNTTIAETDENKENERFLNMLDVLYQQQHRITPKRRASTTPKRRLRRRAGLSSSDHSRKLCASILRVVFGAAYTEDKSSCKQFGRTKLFLKQGQLEQLESVRVQLLSKHAFTIQCAWRRHCRRRKILALIKIQAALRSWHVRHEQVKRWQAASCIQRAVRSWLHQRQQQQESQKLDATNFSTPKLPKKSVTFTDAVSPLAAHSGYSIGSTGVEGGGDADEKYMVCTERSTDGITYHIVPSPVPRYQSDGTPVRQHLASPCHCSPSPRPGQASHIKLRTRGDLDGSYVQEDVVSDEDTLPSNSDHHPEHTYRSANSAFRTVAAAISATFLTQHRFQLSGAFAGIPYLEAQPGVVSRRRMPRVQIKFHTRANPVLKYGHYISNQELRCSLTDCVNEYD